MKKVLLYFVVSTFGGDEEHVRELDRTTHSNSHNKHSKKVGRVIFVIGFLRGITLYFFIGAIKS